MNTEENTNGVVPEFTIDGTRFDSISGFFVELNRVFMQDEDWKLGESLDALNDMLYGGYGALQGADAARVIWLAMDKSGKDLGLDATRRWLSGKLLQPEVYDIAAIRDQLGKLELGEGKTYFELTLEVFSDHASITLIPS